MSEGFGVLKTPTVKVQGRMGWSLPYSSHPLDGGMGSKYNAFWGKLNLLNTLKQKYPCLSIFRNVGQQQGPHSTGEGTAAAG